MVALGSVTSSKNAIVPSGNVPSAFGGLLAISISQLCSPVGSVQPIRTKPASLSTPTICGGVAPAAGAATSTAVVNSAAIQPLDKASLPKTFSRTATLSAPTGPVKQEYRGGRPHRFGKT